MLHVFLYGENFYPLNSRGAWMLFPLWIHIHAIKYRGPSRWCGRNIIHQSLASRSSSASIIAWTQACLHET